MRIASFANGELYHVYNRGVEKRNLFTERRDLERFFESIKLFNTLSPIGSLYEYAFLEPALKRVDHKLVNIVCYCVNPNHYHMMLQQVADNGVSEFMKRLGGGYTNYFNNKYKRNGALFQGRFKAIHVDSNEYLLRLSAYINLNNKVHHLNETDCLSSWLEYTEDNHQRFCNSDIVSEQFGNKKEYKAFAEEALVNILERKNLQKEFEASLLE